MRKCIVGVARNEYKHILWVRLCVCVERTELSPLYLEARSIHLYGRVSMDEGMTPLYALAMVVGVDI